MDTPETALHNELKRKSIFLRDYTTELYASGATTARIEKNLDRIAKRWHTKADFSVLPTCIILNLWDEKEEKSYSVNGRIPADRINFNTVAELSALSWRIFDDGLDIPEATEKYREIIHKERLNPWLVLMLVGAANASFCELFGGDAVSMAIVFIATVDGFFLKQKLPPKGIDYRLVIILAACVSAVIELDHPHSEMEGSYHLLKGSYCKNATKEFLKFLIGNNSFSIAMNDIENR